jgi:hypothetical protein
VRAARHSESENPAEGFVIFKPGYYENERKRMVEAGWSDAIEQAPTFGAFLRRIEIEGANHGVK